MAYWLLMSSWRITARGLGRRRYVRTRSIRPTQETTTQKPNTHTQLAGTTYEATRAFDRDDVDAYARLTGDANVVHQGPDARVHGMLYASMFGALVAHHHPGALYVSQSLEWKQPVRVDEPVTATVTFTSGSRIAALETAAFNSRGEVVLSGTARVLLPRRVVSKAR